MEVLAGKIINYYSDKGVASVAVSGRLEVGNRIHIKGQTTDFEQTVESLQIKHDPVSKVLKGSVAGLKVREYVRKNDTIYRIEDVPESGTP